MVRAGVVPGRRVAAYAVAGLAVAGGVCAATVGVFGVNRVFTGLFFGAGIAIALLFALFGRDGIELTEETIVRRTLWRSSALGWERVVAGRFTLGEKGRWTLALDLNGGEEPHQELVLLSIPPVVRPIGNAYDMRKREQVDEIRTMLRHKRIPVTILPDIAQALQSHWKIAPPAR
ncbi:hypothetical protein D7D52_03275 [Nocardia yunnanensis]|uniref:PH domain-containing protein n=1 Tax=Nocardia yunnanensis TaxID=2382165 RepID=A0A386Z989_9NOCA|nr:hypothetical protein [Nocardia yunnanensis]AYF73049.1 hypothetical protein D7D52_03275 [Nocardia yunnanensis]